MIASPIFTWLQTTCRGARLPPLDDWLPYQRLDYYYTFQHYAAALFGRAFGSGPGTSFNVAVVILAALVLSFAWEFFAVLGVRFSLQLLRPCRSSRRWHRNSAPVPFHHHGAPGRLPRPGIDARRRDPQFPVPRLVRRSVASGSWRLYSARPRSGPSCCQSRPSATNTSIGGYHAVLSGFLLCSWRSPSWPQSRRSRPKPRAT